VTLLQPATPAILIEGKGLQMSAGQDAGEHVSREVAFTLADAVRASGRTTLELSSMVDMQPSTLARRLSGHGRLYVSEAERIASVLGLTVADLIEMAARRMC
jgi:hypothetical protein